MPAHVRIRVLLIVAVAVICGSVFVVTEVQRRSDATAFEGYAAVRELRDAAMQMGLGFDEASLHGAEAAREVEVDQRAVVRAVTGVQTRRDMHGTSERRLIKQQARAATGLTELASRALAGAGGARLEARRDVLLERFVTASDELLRELASERSEARRSAARRPVILVVVLFVLFGLLHLLLVERPASRERRQHRGQVEFGDAMQVARSEAEAYAVLSRHVERVADALKVTVLNRNNSANRLEPVTPVEPGSTTAQGLDGATPDSCLAVRLTRTHHDSPGDERLLTCDVCGRTPDQTTCVPSLVGGEVVGAVLVEHREGLTGARQRLIESSVAEAAPVIANMRNLAIAELRAATDGLTGLPNQRAVHETLKRSAAQAGRAASPLALVVFDLDRFKEVNDAYGHGKGDQVLAAVGAVVAGSLRASDFVGRFGGEEFAAVLPDTDRAGGIAAAEKLRSAIAMISIPSVERRITASFGVAVMPDDAGEPDLLLRLADRALYAAKSAGRDRVETTPAAPASMPS
jgi:diguanylate cyclase (GGDEF)-like protein